LCFHRYVFQFANAFDQNAPAAAEMSEAEKQAQAEKVRVAHCECLNSIVKV